MTRERLPNRRPNETTTLVFGGMSFAMTIGFFPANDRPGEVFASGAKSGCDLDYLLDDACVALSLLLQHGVEPAALAKSMGRAGDGATPASIIGALADRLAEREAAHADA
ncbi:MAG: ribonucleotide reductase [Rhodospirillaceae bacterium]